jgi:hypothetical protein
MMPQSLAVDIDVFLDDDNHSYAVGGVLVTMKEIHISQLSTRKKAAQAIILGHTNSSKGFLHH